MTNEYMCKISKIIDETPSVKTFRLELPDSEKVSFIPGQFVQIMLPGVGPELEKLKRSYSIGSCPLDDSAIEITLDKHGPFTQHMFTLKEGDQMKVFGPYGKFCCPLDIKEDLCLFGGGTGIVPLMCMIRNYTENKKENKITLFYSVKKPIDLIYFKELEDRAARFEKFIFIPTITRLDGEEWSGMTGRINGEMVKASVPDIAKRVSYMCGKPEFGKAISGMLSELQVPKEKIKKEVW